MVLVGWGGYSVERRTGYMYGVGLGGDSCRYKCSKPTFEYLFMMALSFPFSIWVCSSVILCLLIKKKGRKMPFLVMYFNPIFAELVPCHLGLLGAFVVLGIGGRSGRTCAPLP